jgi:hypothetical protein
MDMTGAFIIFLIAVFAAIAASIGSLILGYRRSARSMSLKMAYSAAVLAQVRNLTVSLDHS